MKRKFKIEIIVENDQPTLSLGLQQAKKDIESLGLKVEDVKPVANIRTLKQNNAVHKWCEMVEFHCKERGLTLDVLYKKPFEVPINKHYLKDFFRDVGKVMFGKDSTAKLETDEFSTVVMTVEKAWAERLESNIPFPSLDVLMDKEDY